MAQADLRTLILLFSSEGVTLGLLNLFRRKTKSIRTLFIQVLKSLSWALYVTGYPGLAASWPKPSPPRVAWLPAVS